MDEDEDEDDKVSYYNLSNALDDDKDECHEIIVHPDQLQTTAIIDNLTPCTQYIIRYHVSTKNKPFHNSVTLWKGLFFGGHTVDILCKSSVCYK